MLHDRPFSERRWDPGLPVFRPRLTVCESSDGTQPQQTLIGRDQSQVEHRSRGCQEAIGGIRMKEGQPLCRGDNFVR